MRKEWLNKRIFLYFILSSAFWTLLIVILATVNYREVYNNSLQIVKSSAIDGYNKDLVYRRWATIHGGVYVPVTDSTPPNPWLSNLPERDITTPSGKKLTLVNPAYMTRQVQELGVQQFGLRGHITSLKPLRPANAPDDWEKNALLAFEQGVQESASLEMLNGKEYFRFMKPMITEDGCLKCHRQQGYQIGEIRGGISVSVPWEPVRKQLNFHLLFLLITYGGIWITGLAGAGFIMKGIHNHQKKQAMMEDTLRKSEQKYRSLFDNLAQGMALHDIILNASGEAIDYRFVDANKSFEELTGLKREDIIGKTVLEVMPGTEQVWIEKYGQVVATGKPLHYENYASELEKHYEVVAYRPQPGQFAVIVSDITSRRQNEKQIEQKNKELATLNAEKDKFFSIIAHDLRSPFNGLLGLTILLEDEMSTMTQDQVQKIVVILRKSATNLYSLLENLLEWSQLQRGFITYSPQPILLMPKVLSETELLMVSANKKEICLNYAIPEGLIVVADENMLGGILRNLTSNAVKFTQPGGTVTIAAKTISSQWVEVSVKDTGIGMNKEIVGNLFKLDKDSKRRGTDNEPSTGLGLIICKDFIEKHGWKLWVESEEGIGSTFYFTLPYNAEPEESNILQKSFPLEIANNDVSNLKILIAEDDEVSTLLLEVELETYSKEILRVLSGIAAVEICRDNPNIDLILMDIKMPEMGGYEATRQIRTFNKDVIIIAQTAYALDRRASCRERVSSPV